MSPAGSRALAREQQVATGLLSAESCGAAGASQEGDGVAGAPSGRGEVAEVPHGEKSGGGSGSEDVDEAYKKSVRKRRALRSAPDGEGPPAKVARVPTTALEGDPFGEDDAEDWSVRTREPPQVGVAAARASVGVASSSGVSPAGGSSGLVGVCAEAASLFARHSTGVRRLPLSSVGNSPLNRAISGKHVHDLGKRICTIQGFTRMRYQEGWCHEPDPKDPLAVNRWTNLQARKDPLLSLVSEDQPLYGSLAKSHLLAFLQALKSGSVRWADDGELMVPPEASGELIEHLQHGMFWQVLSSGCLREEDTLRKLILSDNFDAGFALGETEMQLLRRMFGAMRPAKLPPGGRLSEQVLMSLTGTLGQRWHADDLASFYNFCLVVGQEHVDFLADAVTLLVKTDEVSVRPGDFLQASALHPELPWLKIVLLLSQYFSQESQMIKGPGGKQWGNQVKPEAWKRLKAQELKSLEPYEAFVRSVIGRYTLESCVGVPACTLSAQLPGFCVRVGRTLLLSKDLRASVPELSEHEDKLRRAVGKASLGHALPPAVSGEAKWREPLPIRSGVSPSMQSTAGSISAGKVQVDESPMLLFGPDGVQKGLATSARARGFLVGSSVVRSTAGEGIREGAYGTIVNIDTALLVQWDIGSRSDGTDKLASLSPVAAKMSQCKVQDRPALKKTSLKGKPGMGDEEIAPEEAGVPFTICREDDTKLMLRGMLESTLHQLLRAHSASPDLLAVQLPEGERQGTFTLRRPVPPRRLVILPSPAQIHWEKQAGDLTIKYSMREVPGEVFLRGPELALGRRELLTTDSGPISYVSLFWDLAGAASTTPSCQLEEASAVVEIPYGGFSTKDKALGALNRKGLPKIVVHVPYLTNPVQLAQGVRIFR